MLLQLTNKSSMKALGQCMDGSAQTVARATLSVIGMFSGWMSALSLSGAVMLLQRGGIYHTGASCFAAACPLHAVKECNTIHLLANPNMHHVQACVLACRCTVGAAVATETLFWAYCASTHWLSHAFCDQEQN